MKKHPSKPATSGPVGTLPISQPEPTPASLSREVTEAREAELQSLGITDPPAEFFPSKFFDYSDKTIDPRGVSQPRGPKNCVTSYGAARLLQVLGPGRIGLGNPAFYDGLAGSFSDTNLVPWLIFSRNGVEGKPINGGLLMDYWNHGAPWETALMSSQAEVDGSF